PVREAKGRFQTGRSEANVSGLTLRAGGLQLAGDVGMDGPVDDPVIHLKGFAVMEGWQQLPGIPEALARRARGGPLGGSLAFRAPLSQLAAAPVSGDFQLREWELLPAPGSDRAPAPVRIQSLAGRFQRKGGGLELAALTLAGDGLEARGNLALRDIAAPGSPL